MESSHSNPLNARAPAPSPCLNESESIQPETDTHSEVQSGVQPFGTRSQYWRHCARKKRKGNDGKETLIGVCIYCQIEIPADPLKNGTSGLKKHLVERCKSSPLYKGPPTASLKGQTILSNESVGEGSLVSHSFNQKRCEQKVIEYMIMDEMSFKAVEGKGFLALMHEVQSRFKVPNRKKVATGIYDLFLEKKGMLKSVLHEKRVSITTDTWTSIQNINYMVVTCHFIDSDWKLHKRIINFIKITSHSGDDIGKMLEVCLHDLGIGKVFSIIVDNASSNNAAIDHMKKKFKSKNTLIVDERYLHLRSACHILNLIVKDGLNELKSSIKAIRNAVAWIHSSPSRLQKFRDFAFLEDFEKRLQRFPWM
ncbi:hypothetical protein Dimus_039485 [Dionaea muscipula]